MENGFRNTKAKERICEEVHPVVQEAETGMVVGIRMFKCVLIIPYKVDAIEGFLGIL